ncbi:hypothetical protein [Sulfuritalea sp.]|uniref:hypothetical protein n=1 Tax=Sulfuritalea sp. TaxID=2480090 RepID=UPI001AC88332|nr:hypothetical protein [Sulfuritalea sp.]MBN8475174.1 hypothetical protein [Sulfuritalea sp.]
MDANGLGMDFGGFFMERLGAHLVAWLALGFFGLWIAFCFGVDETSLDVRLTIGFIGAVATFVLYGLSCIVLIPLLLLLLLARLSIRLEARWRIRHRRPYVPSPLALPAPVARRSASDLLPLLIGIWIGASWGGDD